MRYSLSELSKQFEQEDADLLLECVLTIQVDVSIERLHESMNDGTGKAKLVLGDGWLVSLGVPSNVTLTTCASVFSDGEPQMICDLKYLGGERNAVSFGDAVKALGIDADAKIWTIKKAP